MEKTMDDFITKKGLKDREELKNELQKDSNLQNEFLTSYLEAGEVVKNGIFNKYNINAAVFASGLCWNALDLPNLYVLLS